jgi:homoserine O-acetyltransferase
LNNIRKHHQAIRGFKFLCGESLDIDISYETYGRLNESADNAILICHFWTGTSHAAGKYTNEDALPGWWDALIGPGKTIDTNLNFVICTDTLSNVQAKDPRVCSTGPASIDPKTGQPYGSHFPVLTFRDIVHAQRALLEQLGIRHLKAVGGPSGGGMQALEWAVTYPGFMDKVFAVNSFGRSSAFFTMAVYRICRALIEADPYWLNGDYYDGPGPQTGFQHALSYISLLAQTPTRINSVARDSDAGWQVPEQISQLNEPDRLALYEQDFNAFIKDRASFADANAFLTIGKAATLHDVGLGRGGFEKALASVQADVLMIPNKQDIYFPAIDSQDVVDAIKAGQGNAELYPVDSEWGHFACLFDTNTFADRLHKFLYHRSHFMNG